MQLKIGGKDFSCIYSNYVLIRD